MQETKAKLPRYHSRWRKAPAFSHNGGKPSAPNKGGTLFSGKLKGERVRPGTLPCSIRQFSEVGRGGLFPCHSFSDIFFIITDFKKMSTPAARRIADDNSAMKTGRMWASAPTNAAKPSGNIVGDGFPVPPFFPECSGVSRGPGDPAPTNIPKPSGKIVGDGFPVPPFFQNVPAFHAGRGTRPLQISPNLPGTL